MPPLNALFMPAEVRQQIDAMLRLLQERGALRNSHCPECDHTDWNMDFLAISATTLQIELRSAVQRLLPPSVSDFPYVFTVRPPAGVLATSYIPVCSLVCTTCGYTKQFNLQALGVATR